MSEERILLNRICTPDGTVLTSYHRHDYKTYEDLNGHTYMVDGGVDYLRYNVVKEAPPEFLTVYLTDDHEANRQAFHWGSYGKQGDQPLTWRPLCDLSTDHIEAIIATQKQLTDSWRKTLFETELKYRLELDI